MSKVALPAAPSDDVNAVVSRAVEEMILTGASLRELATKFGVPHQTLHRWLLSELPEQYRAAQREGLLARIVEADEALDNAKSHIDIARAREKCRFTRWDAERRLPALFAQRTEVSGPGGGPIPVRLDPLERARRSMFALEMAIEAEIVSEPAPEAPSLQAISGAEQMVAATKRMHPHPRPLEE